MKNKIASILLIAGLSLSAFTVNAQTTNNPPPPAFFDTALTYFTAFNTNLTTFSIDRGSVWAGADYVSGVNVSSHIGFSYNLGSSTPGNGFHLESVTRNAGIAGTILSQQAGAGYHVSLYDARISATLAGGYDWNARAAFIAPTIDIRKAMTQRTFAGLRMDVPIMFRHGSGNYVPRVGVFTGFTF